MHKVGAVYLGLALDRAKHAAEPDQRAAALRELLDSFRDDNLADEFTAPLGAALDTIIRAIDRLTTGAIATDFLELTSLGIYAWLWAKMARAAPDNATGQAKREVAKYFYARLLPRTLTLEQTIAADPSGLMTLPDELI